MQQHLTVPRGLVANAPCCCHCNNLLCATTDRRLATLSKTLFTAIVDLCLNLGQFSNRRSSTERHWGTSITSYDPDACRSQWGSYISADFERVSSWERNWHAIYTWRSLRGDVYDSALNQATSYETRISTITNWKPAPTPQQCDGVPRFTSHGEIETKLLIPRSYFAGDNTTGTPAELPNPWSWSVFVEDMPLYPSCEIHPEDCPRQFDLFQEDFATWTKLLSDINPHPSDTNPTCIDPMRGKEVPGLEKSCYTEDMLKEKVDINAWIALRQYQKTRGFLGDCQTQQFKEMCVREPQLWMNATYDRPKKANGSYAWPRIDKRIASQDSCRVTANRFALIYFRPKQTSSRDLCANSGWGNDMATAGDNLTVTKTATLDQIVFQRRVPPLSWEGMAMVNTG